MLSKIFKIFSIIYLNLLFFEAFVFLIGGRPFFWSYIILIILYLFVLIKPQKLILHILYLYKATPFRYLCYFLSFLFISTIILLCTHYARITILYYIFVKLIPATLLPLIMISYIVPKYIKIKQVIQNLFLLIIFIYTVGIIGFLGDLLNIKILSNVTNFFSNLKEATQGVTMMIDDISGTPRLRGIFHEPGSLGKFIVVFLPIIYKICLSKFAIFKNKFLNIFTKKCIIPYTWLCLILTMSPMCLIFCLIITAFYFHRILKKLLFNRLTFILSVAAIILMSISMIFVNYQKIITNSYLYRIINVFSCRNLDDLVTLEASLASRIASYVNTFILFLKKPFIGYGYDNVRFFMYNQFLNSPVPLTKENIMNMLESIELGTGVAFNRSLLFGLLAETGIIGTFLYYLYLFKNLTFINKIKNYTMSGLETDFIEGIYLSCITVIVLSFYIYSFNTTYIYFIYALVISYVIYIKTINSQKMNKD